MAPGGAGVSVKMTPPKAQTVITSGGGPLAKPSTLPITSAASTTTAPARVTAVSQVN